MTNLTVEVLEEFLDWKAGQEYPDLSAQGFINHKVRSQKIENWNSVVEQLQAGVYDDLALDAEELAECILNDLTEGVNV